MRRTTDRPGASGQLRRSLRRRDGLRIALVSVLAAGIALGFTVQQARSIRQDDDATAALRARLVADHASAYGRTVEGLAASMERSIGQKLPAGDLEYLRDYPAHHVYGLSGMAEDGGQPARVGTLTGLPPLSAVTAAQRREMLAALQLDGQFAAHLSGSSEAVWIYYTSASGFMYLAPKVPIADFQFTDELLTKEFWTQAVPAANPRHETVITKLYEDGAGKGLMITVSRPVLDHGVFVGVASADIGIVTLRTMLNVGDATGESLLVGRDGDVVAQPGRLRPGQRVDPAILALGEGTHRVGGDWWVVRPMLGGRLVLLHRLGVAQVAGHAFVATAPLWALTAMLVGLLYLMLRLRVALGEVTMITRTDPLTGLLNRRGFFEDLTCAKVLAGDGELPQSLALLDLDFFKQINDQFGHNTGDRVLSEVGRLLTDNIRVTDRLCRWGGEEFALFLPGTDVPAAVNLLERLRSTVAAGIVRPDGQHVTISAGVVNAPPDVDLDRVIAAADQFLYDAKQSGRDRVCGQQVRFEPRTPQPPTPQPPTPQPPTPQPSTPQPSTSAPRPMEAGSAAHQRGHGQAVQ